MTHLKAQFAGPMPLAEKSTWAQSLEAHTGDSGRLRERMKNRMLLKQHAVKVWKQAEWVRSLS